jgi:hypothetical protein
MPGSPLRNRGEFLEEAELLAWAGAVSILINAPLVRPGAIEDKDSLSGQDTAVTEQKVVDFRRALDLLLARGDVRSQAHRVCGSQLRRHGGGHPERRGEEDLDVRADGGKQRRPARAAVDVGGYQQCKRVSRS